MNSHGSIRSDLVADRENQPRRRRRLQESAFGIYRPLDIDTVERIQDALAIARPKIQERLDSSSRFTELVIPDDHGVTYVQRKQVVRALKTSAMRNFSLIRVQKGINNYNYRQDGQPEIPFKGLGWVGDGLKLAGRLAIKSETNELAEDSAAINEFLDEAGGSNLEVYEPDHVTLCKFPRSRKGHAITNSQKIEVEGIVQAELQAADIGSVVLQEIVVGDGSYREPIPMAA